MRPLFLLLLGGVCGCGAAGPVGPPVEWTADVQAVADGNNRFALDLYRQLAATPGNFVFSPFSAHAALAMTAAGAAGPTRDEMVKALHLPADPAKALAAGDLSRYYARGGSGYELAVANALWGQKGLPWRPDFLAGMRDHFGAGFREADFAADPDGERRRINRWAEDNTRGKIRDVLPPGAIDPNARIVLANAVYFKGEWAAKFDPSRTRDAPFTRADGSQRPVPMMKRKEGFRWYAGGDGFDLAELPYRGDDVSMVLLVPKRPDGLADCVRTVSPEALGDWLGKAREVHGSSIELPKFRVESAHALTDPLRALGVSAAFGAGADFSGMSPDRSPFVRAVLQKAFVDVNEEGTEAAAVTVVVGAVKSAEPPTFRADRPFLFLIRDVRHGTVLFLGRYESP